MSLPDRQAGKRHRCPLCFTYIDVPFPGTPPGPAPEGSIPKPVSRPGEPSRRDHGEADAAAAKNRLRWLSRGLGFHYARLILLLVTLLVWIIMVPVLTFSSEDNWDPEILHAGVLGMLALESGCAVIGSILCLAAPGDAHARRFLLLSLVLDPTTIGFPVS
jgi:hypothetical protein